MESIDGFFRDEHGLPIPSDGDGGDCLANTGREIFICFERYRTTDEGNDAMRERGVTQLFDIGILRIDGKWVRYWKARPAEWKGENFWNVPERTSRDQFRPAIIALHERPYVGFLEEIKANAKSNWYRYPNGDFCGPLDFLLLRDTNKKKTLGSYFFIVLGLLHFITDAMFNVGWFPRKITGAPWYSWTWKYDPDNVGDLINHTIVDLYLGDHYAGRLHRFGHWLLERFLKPNCGNLVLGFDHVLFGAWAWYYKPTPNFSTFTQAIPCNYPALIEPLLRKQFNMPYEVKHGPS